MEKVGWLVALPLSCSRVLLGRPSMAMRAGLEDAVVEQVVLGTRSGWPHLLPCKRKRRGYGIESFPHIWEHLPCR